MEPLKIGQSYLVTSEMEKNTWFLFTPYKEIKVEVRRTNKGKKYIWSDLDPGHYMKKKLQSILISAE